MFDPRVVSREEARMIAGHEAQQSGTLVDGSLQPPPIRRPKSISPFEALKNVATLRHSGGWFRTAFTEEEIQRLPGIAQTLARAANELTSPFNIAFTVATAGLGPAAVTGIKTGQIALRQAITQGNRGLATRIAAKVLDLAGSGVSAAAAPITRGGFGQRLAAEQALGLGAGVAAHETSRRIPETAPGIVRYGAPLAAGLLGGGLTVGGISGIRAGVGAAPGVAKTARLRVGQQVARIPGAGEVGLRVGGVPSVAGAADSKVGRIASATGADPNTVYEFQYKVVELDDLITSNTDAGAPNPQYAPELQPRLRGDRVASRLQIETIAKQLNADELLHDAGTLDRGPMIVGSDMMVESGNGRILALRLARDKFKNKHDEYTNLLNDKLSEFGLDADATKGMRSPVLVRERVTDVDRVRFTAEANESATLAMSPLEQALQDSKRLSDDSIASLVVTDSQNINEALRSTRNLHVTRAFVDNLQPNEQAALLTSKGELNNQGLQRLKAAIFAKVFPGDAGKFLTEVFIESSDPIIVPIEHAIFDALPKLARSEGLVRSGQRASTLGIGDNLAQAVVVLARMKRNKTNIDEFVRQAGMFGQELDSFEAKLLIHLNTFGNARKVIREFLQDYSDAVVNSPHPSQQAMMPEARISKEQIVDNLISQKETAAKEGTLFGDFERRRMAEGAATPETPRTQLESPVGTVEDLAPTTTTAAREGATTAAEDAARISLLRNMIASPVTGIPETSHMAAGYLRLSPAKKGAEGVIPTPVRTAAQRADDIYEAKSAVTAAEESLADPRVNAELKSAEDAVASAEKDLTAAKDSKNKDAISRAEDILADLKEGAKEAKEPITELERALAEAKADLRVASFQITPKVRKAYDEQLAAYEQWMARREDSRQKMIKELADLEAKPATTTAAPTRTTEPADVDMLTGLFRSLRIFDENANEARRFIAEQIDPVLSDVYGMDRPLISPIMRGYPDSQMLIQVTGPNAERFVREFGLEAVERPLFGPVRYRIPEQPSLAFSPTRTTADPATQAATDMPGGAAARVAEEAPTAPDVPAMTEADRLAEQLRATPGYRGRTDIEIGGERVVVEEGPPTGPGGTGRDTGAGGGRRGGGEDGGPTTVEGDPLPIPPEIDAMPEGITRDIALAREKIRQAEPGAISRALDALPGLRHLYRFFVPARNLTKAQHEGWVAKSMSESRYLTEAFGRRNEVFQELDSAFGPGFKTGEKAQLSYIGPSDRAKSPLVGRAIDVLPNPEHYVLNQSQLDAVASVRAYGDEFLDKVSREYGVKIGRFPIKENAAFVPNVDVSDDALELMGNAWTAARVGRAKTRVWEDAIARQAYTPDFQPETNLVRLFEASDVAKGHMVSKEVLKRSVGGKTLVEVKDALHPKLRKYKESVATKIRNLRARIDTAERESSIAARQEKQVSTQVSQAQKRARPMLERIDELGDEFGPELSHLSGQTRELLLRAAALERRGVVLKLRRETATARGIDLAVELDKLAPLLDNLQKRYKSVGLGDNVLVEKGIFRYFPKKDADSLDQLLEVSTNPVLSAAWEIRNIKFNLDLSPITGVHLPLGFLADPVGTIGQLLRGTRTAAERGQFLRDLTPAGLAEKIAGDPTWAEFAAVSGRPMGQTATEYSGGILRRIPGFSKANEAMFTAVTYRSKAMYDGLVQDYVKAGIPRNEAIIAASENVHRVIPLIDHALLGQSQARAKLIQSLTISPSFIFRPPELMAEAATALVKVGLKQTLTTKQKMALRTMMMMAATVQTISITSAVMDAWKNDKDVWKAGLSATDDMSIHLMDGRQIPLGGPYRSMINAMKPVWVNRDMDYMVPFWNMPRWALGKMTPAFRTQYDMIKNRDFRNRRIRTGEFPMNLLQGVMYEFEGVVPLSIGKWSEGWRTGATLAKTAEESFTQSLGTSLYDRQGPWVMRSEWRNELRQYWDIPTDPNKLGTKDNPVSRTTYRQRTPMTDAKLFIIGDVTSLMRIKGNPLQTSSRSVLLVLSLIRENNIDPDDIRGIRERKEDRAAAEKAGRRLTPNPVDRLISLLEEARPAETAPASREPTPALPAPTPVLPTPTPAMPAQPGPRSTPTREEFRNTLRGYLATRTAQKTPEPVGVP